MILYPCQLVSAIDLLLLENWISCLPSGNLKEGYND